MAAAAEEDVVYRLWSTSTWAGVVVNSWDLPAVEEMPEADLPRPHLGQDRAEWLREMLV